MLGSAIHESYLENIVNNPDLIGEPREGLKVIIRDLIWMPEGKGKYSRMCDLILVTDEDYGIPVELKGSVKKRWYALEQLKCGRKFIRSNFGLQVIYGKFVVYNYGKLRVEIIHYN